ncbi:MAG: hypothetical protein ISQ54_04615 [Candidatus Poseidonia sp.]|nr:hypothetical protein [Poseidonia sp.]
MKNMTPVILGLLMLTSFFAVIDFTELEEPMVIEDTSGRAGADPSVIAITTPKETSCDDRGCRNTLMVGEETTFAAYIQNSGDANIDELSYTVTVYLTDFNKNVGMVAKDASGNDLQWENLDAMCDDGTVCDFDSTTDPLLPGNYLAGGKYTLQRAGSDITWTPIQGEYLVEVKVSSPTDADAANNAELVYVVVEDWYDIQVDLAWDTTDQTSKTDWTNPSGDFTLTVIANGSDTFDPRDVQVRLALAGDYSSATASDGTDLTQNSGITVLTAGTPATVNIYENETDPNATQDATRNVLSYLTSWTFTGSVAINTAQNESTLKVEAEVIGYTMYGPFEDCVESSDATEGNENVTTWNNLCEVSLNNDDNPRTDADEIIGTTSTYHDIRIARMGVYQGYNSDGTGLPSTFVQSDENTDLNVGASLIYADVEHRGSNGMDAYNWDLSYSVSLDGTVMFTGTTNECVEGTDVPYTHQPLGGFGQLVGSACVMISLEPGEYEFEFTLTMADKPSPEGEPIEWIGAFDARMSNNVESMTVDVVNNLPLITSFELVNDGDLVVGQEEFLQLSVTAFDVDDPSGEGLSFYYSYQGGEMLGCGERNQTEGGTICSTPILGEYIGNLAINIVVNDSHGGQVAQTMMLNIWNDAVAQATTDAGITISYPLQYFALSDFTIATFADKDIASYDKVVLEGFSGTYAAVAAMDYAPSTTFPANDILSQSLSVTVDKALEATSLWYIDGSGKWILFADASEDVDATTEAFVYSIPANSPVVPSGTLVLMGGELAQASIPDASVSGFNAEALKGGAIGVTWGITGTLLSSDNIVVTICDGQEDCAEPFTQTVADEDRSYSYSGTNTVHGTVYHVSVAVCNEEGCSTAGKGTVTADKQVDGGVAATALTVQEDGENWIISWDVTGDTSDVAMWHVCYNRGESFTAAEMPASCPDSVMGADANTMTIAQPTAAGTFEYYFTAVPMDALGNMDAADSMNSITYNRAADNSNDGDGTNTIGDDGDDASSSVPTWTWGLIGGVVIVAFIAGAFILSRGDGEGGEGKDWDY